MMDNFWERHNPSVMICFTVRIRTILSDDILKVEEEPHG